MADLVNPSKAGDEQGPSARVGAVIKGKWTLDGLLGVGGMAAVYSASHRNGQRAALKILHADFSREKPICERFLREAYVSNKVNHSATVQILDDDVTEQGEPFLIMELLLGETVRDAWKKCGRTMPIGRVLQICERVVDCLSSCHAIGVIHRDLKPANIFITSDGEIKVLDFGVAQMRDATAERTATGTALGTPAYMSPEQAMGLVDQLDGRADLFSVGAMMHALVTGHRINNGRTEQEALVMAATKPAPSVVRLAPHLPIDLIKVIDKALAWDRRNRFQDAREMQRALTELMPAQHVGVLGALSAPRAADVAPNLETVLFPPAAAQTSSGRPLVAAATAVVPPAASAPRSPGTPGAAPPAALYDPLVGYGAFAQDLGVPATVLLQSPAAIPAEVPESDPRVQAVRDLMKHFDRVLPSVRQFGWAHPATDRTLRTAHEAIAEALHQQPGLFAVTLRPYSFMTLGHAVWEPGPPFDSIPYNLFACGMRSFGLQAGLSLDELRHVLALFLLDPGRDLPPEDDLAAAFWERALPHVTYEVVDAFAEGDAAEREAFYGEADQIEGLAEQAARSQISRTEAHAMALSTDDAALFASRTRSPFTLDEPMRVALASQFELSREAWGERYVDALVEGYLDSVAHRDAPLVLASLRKSAADLTVAGRFGVAVQLNRAVIERLRERVEGAADHGKLAAALTDAMFGGETLELMLKGLQDDQGPIEVFDTVLSVLGPNELSSVLSSLRATAHPRVLHVLVGFVARHLTGHEAEVAAAVPGSEPEALTALLQLLSRAGTPAANAALQQLAASEDVGASVEARVLVATSPSLAQEEVGGLLDNPSVFVRLAALRAATRYQMRNVWSTVARIIGGKTFNDLGSDERRELLRAVILLGPERGESLALDLAKKGGVLVAGSREATRALAAELLGDLSNSPQVGASLHELAQSRWGVSEETRTAAAAAASRIAHRVASSAQHGGPG